ncbi:MAG: type II toxin-antitoxin system VapC family toxin [Deltaproteobacteria bacterium]|jgi:tRNA(fMet)-specific endonuclease VapC
MKSDFRYLLDTDIASYIIRRFPKPLAKAMQFSEQFAISTVTRFELGRAKRFLKLESSGLLLASFLEEVPTIEFDSSAADAAGDIYSALQSKGKTIGVPDSMIAGHALSHSMVLVTNNQKHFERISELRTQNWMQ